MAISDNFVELMKLVFPFLTLCVTSLLSYLVFVGNKKASAAAVEVKEVKDTLKESTATTAQQIGDLKDDTTTLKATTSTIHELVNAKLGKVLEALALERREKADRTGETRDIARAEKSEREYDEHQANQAIVDARSAADTRKPGK